MKETTGGTQARWNQGQGAFPLAYWLLKSWSPVWWHTGFH